MLWGMSCQAVQRFCDHTLRHNTGLKRQERIREIATRVRAREAGRKTAGVEPTSGADARSARRKDRPFFLTKIIRFSLNGPTPPTPGSTAMLVCSCNFISQKEIEDTITALLDEDCWQLIVPAKVYHAMQKRGRCCGCFPNVVDIIIRTTEKYHAANHSTDDEIVAYISRIKKFHEENRRVDLERRQQSHRAA